MKEKNPAVVRGGDGRDRVFSTDLNSIAYLAMSGSSDRAAPYPVEAIITLLRSDEDIHPEVRELMAELFVRGMNARAESDEKLLYFRLHNHGGKNNPFRIAITIEEHLDLHDIHQQAKADPAIKYVAKYMKDNHGVSDDLLREVRKTGKDFEEWFSKQPAFDRNIARLIFAHHSARLKPGRGEK